MKSLVIKIVIGVAGFAGGFASGYLVRKKMTDIQFEEVTEEEMASIENKVAAEAGEKKDILASSENRPESNVSEDIGAAQELPETPDEVRNVLQGKTPYMKADAETKTAYEKLWKTTSEYSNEENANQYPVWRNEVSEKDSGKGTEKGTDEAEEESPEEENFDEEFLEQLEQEAVEAGNDFEDPPHQIDMVSFYSDHPEFDKVTIKYYEPDNVWLDENDEMIADISSYIGIGNKNPFAEEPYDDDPDIRFWTNPRYGTDYEFVRHHRSYQETVGE